MLLYSNDSANEPGVDKRKSYTLILKWMENIANKIHCGIKVVSGNNLEDQ